MIAVADRAAVPSAVERRHLARARDLALRGRGRAGPNPLVGAVVARGDEVVAEGWHEGAGTLHAEAMAIGAAGEAARGATVVCTLEPCSHHGRTPPCADALVDAGVARAVIGCRDPLERGRAGGVDVLRRGGVEVAVADGADEAACRELISAFLVHALTGRPEVTLKLATSLDGRIATPSGESRWITGPAARALVHRWRADADAVAVGSGTALADDPALTAREVAGPFHPPLRVVLDGRARLPADSLLARTAGEAPVLVVTSPRAPAAAVAALRAAGAEVAVVPDAGDRLAGALDLLGARGVQSVLAEGGAGLAGALVAGGHVDRVAWFLAPMLIGGDAAPGALGGAGVASLADAPRLIGRRVETVGDDLLVTGRLRPLPGGGPSSPA